MFLCTKINNFPPNTKIFQQGASQIPHSFPLCMFSKINCDKKIRLRTEHSVLVLGFIAQDSVSVLDWEVVNSTTTLEIFLENSSYLLMIRLEGLQSCEVSAFLSTGHILWILTTLRIHREQKVCPHMVSIGFTNGWRQMWHVSSSSTVSQ